MADLLDTHHFLKDVYHNVEYIGVIDEESIIFEWKREKYKNFLITLNILRVNPIIDAFFYFRRENLYFVAIRKFGVLFVIGVNSGENLKVLEFLLVEVIINYFELDDLNNFEVIIENAKKALSTQFIELVKENYFSFSIGLTNLTRLINLFLKDYLSSKIQEIGFPKGEVQKVIKNKKNPTLHRDFTPLEAMLMVIYAESEPPEEDSALRRDRNVNDFLREIEFNKGLISLICGDKQLCNNILLKTIAIVQHPSNKGGFRENVKSVYLDANNSFKYQKFATNIVFQNIYVARVFTWRQVIDILKKIVSKLEQVEVILIAGITKLFRNREERMIDLALRDIREISFLKERPLIVMSAPLERDQLRRVKTNDLINSSLHEGLFILLHDGKQQRVYSLSKQRNLKWKPRIPIIRKKSEYKS